MRISLFYWYEVGYGNHSSKPRSFCEPLSIRSSNIHFSFHGNAKMESSRDDDVVKDVKQQTINEESKLPNEKENEGDADERVSPMIAMHIVYIMPFFLRLSSNLPPVYLSVALLESFGESGAKAGLVMGMFQAARAAVIGITLYSPVVSICCGSFFGVLGFVCLAMYPIWKDNSHALALFSVANVLTGFSNAPSALQIFAKQEYSNDMVGLRSALRRQSAFSGVAPIISYFLSGIMYDKFGLASVGLLGCLCVGIASISLIFYLIARNPQPVVDVVDDKGVVDVVGDKDDKVGRSSVLHNDATGDRWKSIKYGFIGISQEDFQQAIQESEVTEKMGESDNEDESQTVVKPKRTSHSSPVRKLQRCRTSRLNTNLGNILNSNRYLALEHQEEVLKHFSGAGEVVLNKIVFVVAGAFLIEALTSGSLFSVGPFYIQETFGKSTSYTGTIFALSSVFGTVFTMLFISDKGKELVRKVLPTSSEIYSLMLIISLATLALIAPSFPVQIICIMIIIGFNETLWTLLTEMEGAFRKTRTSSVVESFHIESNRAESSLTCSLPPTMFPYTGAITTEKFYRTIGPTALLFHSIINIVVSFLCPILIDVKAWLPYAFTGGIALMFSLFFLWKIEAQRRQNAELIAEVVAKNRMSIAQARALRMSFTTLEILTRMASVKQKRDNRNNTGKTQISLFPLEESEWFSGEDDDIA